MNDLYLNLLGFREMCYKNSYINPNKTRISIFLRTRGQYIKSRGVLIDNMSHKLTHPTQEVHGRIRG